MSSPLNMPHRVGARPIFMKATPIRACDVRPSQGDTTGVTEPGYLPYFIIGDNLHRSLAWYRIERSLLRSSGAVLEPQ
jgi:hypothetical protein